MAMGKAKLAKAALAFVFATDNYQSEYTQLCEEVQKISGCEHLIGCSGMGVLTLDSEFEGKSVVAVLVLRSDQLSALSFCVFEDGAVPVGTTIRNQIRPELRENSLLVVLPDVRCVQPAELVQQIGGTLEGLPPGIQ